MFGFDFDLGGGGSSWIDRVTAALTGEAQGPPTAEGIGPKGTGFWDALFSSGSGDKNSLGLGGSGLNALLPALSGKDSQLRQPELRGTGGVQAARPLLPSPLPPTNPISIRQRLLERGKVFQ